MPLSEEEQRLLEQMEDALAAEDPKFVSALRGVSSRARSKRIAILATVAFFGGIAILMTGAVLASGQHGSGIAVAVAGFIVMLGSAYVALTHWRRLRDPDLPDNVVPLTRTRGSTAVPKSSGFMNRMEDRWRRRREDY